MENTRFEILSQEVGNHPDDINFESTIENESLNSSSYVKHVIGKIIANLEQVDLSSFGPSANLCSATLGAGILALPFAISSSGIGLGLILLTVAAVSTIISIDMLVKSCATLKQNSYEKLTVILFGNTISWIIEGCIILLCFGTCVAYIVAVGDILEEGILGTLRHSNLPSFVNREFVMILFWALVMFPLSLFEKINALRYASLFGVSSISFLVFAVFYHSIRTYKTHTQIESDQNIFEVNNFAFTFEKFTHRRLDTLWGLKLWPESFLDAIKACPIILFAFNCQLNVPAIFDEIKPRHHHTDFSPVLSMRRVARRGVMICFIFYTVMGYFAFFEFGNNTQDNVLKNYCVQDTHDPLMIMAFCGITIAIVLGFPLNVLPSRHTLDIIVNRCFHRINLKRENSSSNIYEVSEFDEPLMLPDMLNDTPEPNLSTSSLTRQSILHKIKHVMLTLIISGSALLVAIVVPDISIIFGILGGFASSLIGLIMPASFYLKLGLGDDNKWMRYAAWILIISGAMIGLLSTAVTIHSIFQLEPEEDVCANSSPK